jgi:thioredoxin reductase (NADPH)
MHSSEKIYDCVIIGGGPGGLTAALYLGRFRRKIAIIENGLSRANYIPISHNFPTKVDGIPGKEVINNLKLQLTQYDLPFFHDTILNIIKNEDGSFTLHGKEDKYHSKNIIIATGVEDIRPDLPEALDATHKGLIRYCPICDGYEVRDKEVGVIGYDNHALNETIFLHTYTTKLTFFTSGKDFKLTIPEEKIKELGIKIIRENIINIEYQSDKFIVIETALKQKFKLDTLYASIGLKPRSEFAIKVGVAVDEEKYIIVDKTQKTSVKGIYAIGDVVGELTQMSVALGHAAIAATEIHNELLESELT